MTKEEALDIARIGNEAVKEAQRLNHEKGIPNVYSRNGKIVWELPDGTITDKDPFEAKK